VAFILPKGEKYPPFGGYAAPFYRINALGSSVNKGEKRVGALRVSFANG
jgi:hypothetical protein